MKYHNSSAASLAATKKIAFYLGVKNSLFKEVQKAISLVFDVLREQELPPAVPENTAVIFIEALGGGSEQAISLIRQAKEAAGKASLFLIIDQRDPDFLFTANRLGAEGFIEAPADIPNLLSLIHQGSRHRSHKYRGEITSFFSLKGGVGRTTLAVNTAHHLNMLSGGKTVLVDLNMPLGDCALFLSSDENQGYFVNDFILNLSRLDEKIIYDSLPRHTSGIYCLGLPGKMEELEQINDTNLKPAFVTLRHYFDQVIIDCASDLGAVSLACLDASDNIMLIAEPSLSAMRALKVAHDTCLRLGYSAKNLRLVLNRDTSLADELTGAMLEALELPFAARVENNYLAFLHALQEEKLLHDYRPGCLADRQIKAIAEMIFTEVASAVPERPRPTPAATAPLDWLRNKLSRAVATGGALTGVRQ